MLPLCSLSKCSSVPLLRVRVGGRSLVKESVRERGRMKRIVERGVSISDMALVWVEGLVCEAPPQSLPWLVSRYYL